MFQEYLMGHSDIGVTMNVYTHVDMGNAEEEVRKPGVRERPRLFKWREMCLGQCLLSREGGNGSFT